MDLASSNPERSQPERLAQVHLTDLGVGKDFFGTPGSNDRALIDDVGPGAHAQGLAHIMVSDQDADAAVRQLAEHRGLLRQVAEAELCPAVHRQQRDVGVLQADAARVARHEPDDHVEGGGLAGTIGPEESHDLTAGELERQVAHDLTGLVALGESGSLQRTHGCAVDCGLAGSPLPASGGGGFTRGAMVMCTRWSVPGDAAAWTRCSRMLYTSRGPEISVCPSVSQASFVSRTVPSFR